MCVTEPTQEELDSPEFHRVFMQFAHKITCAEIAYWKRIQKERADAESKLSLRTLRRRRKRDEQGY